MNLHVCVWLVEGGLDLFALVSSTLPFPAATPSNSRHHLPGSRCSSKACLRSAFHCSHSAGTRPGATIATQVAGDPHTAHCGAATIPIAMEAIVVARSAAYPSKSSRLYRSLPIPPAWCRASGPDPADEPRTNDQEA